MTTEPAGQESGGKLREQFEATRKVLVETFVATNPALRPGDFDGVEPAQFAARADEVKATRAAEAEQTLRDALKAKGIEDADLDSALAKLTASGQASTEKVETPASRVASLQKLGAPPARTDVRDTSNLSGRARIEAARRRKLES